MENTKRVILSKKYHLSEYIKVCKSANENIPHETSEELQRFDQQLEECNLRLGESGAIIILEEIKSKLSELKPIDKKEDRKIRKWRTLLENLILFHKDGKEIKQILRNNTGFAIACFSYSFTKIKTELELDCRGSLRVFKDCVFIEVGEIKKDKNNMKKARLQLRNVLLILKEVASVLHPQKNIILIGHIFYTGDRFSLDEFISEDKLIEYKYQRV